MADFWSTLVASGTSAASKVLTPLGAGIGQGISNLVQQGQNKVAGIAGTIVKTTDPNKPAASQPATPPTTSVPTAAAQTQAKLGIMIVVAVALLIFFLRKKG